MAALRKMAEGIAWYLARELNFDQDNTEIIRYGTEIILGALLKGTVVLVISYQLGITPYVLAALVTSSILRLFSGGVHCASFGRCLLFGTAVVVLIGSIANVTGSLMNKQAILLLIILNAFTGLYMVRKWAPADSHSKPITKKDKRENYKKLSILYVITWTAVVTLFVLLAGSSHIAFSLALASIGGFMVQVLSLCPAGYRVVAYIDMWLSKIIPSRR